METKDRIIKARVKLQKDNPFFAYLVLNLNISENKEIKSMGVDIKGNLIYNKKWVSKLDDEQLKGVLCHEVLHLALQHFIRGENKEHEIYNIATDLVINCILTNNNFALPKGCVPCNNEFELVKGLILKELDKKTADEVYHEIMKSGKVQIRKVMGLGGIGFDEHKFGGGKAKANGTDIEKEKKKWNRVFSEASIYAKQQGKLPDGIERLVDLVLNEKVNWKHLLYKYITNELPYDYTYSRPSKKSISTGVYMPSILRENLDVVVSIDTSGSINQDELSEFLNEIINIAKSFNNIKITLIVCDSEIKDVYVVANGSIETIRNLKIKGGGGTSHIPIYEYIKEHLPNAKFVINFTDGYTNFPEHESCRSIWVLTKNSCKEDDIPFGEVIKL